MDLRFPLALAAGLLLAACTHLEGKASAGGAGASRPAAGKAVVSPEREEQYVWDSELA